MIKKICDRCGGEYCVETINLPIYMEVFGETGSGVKLCKFPMFTKKDVDLCLECRGKLSYLVAFYMDGNDLTVKE